LRSILMDRLLRSSRDILVGSLSSIPYLLLEFEEPMFLKLYFPQMVSEHWRRICLHQRVMYTLTYIP
jgi:hypothetical protein